MSFLSRCYSLSLWLLTGCKQPLKPQCRAVESANTRRQTAWYTAAVSVVGLLSAGIVHALPTFTTQSFFDAAEAGRTYMDVGAAWNGSTVISPAAGDTFRFRIRNTAPTSASNDAVNFTLRVQPASGFRLLVVNGQVIRRQIADSTPASANCRATTETINISQISAGSPFQVVSASDSLAIPANGCEYEFEFQGFVVPDNPGLGLETDSDNYPLTYQWEYANDTSVPAADRRAVQTIEARRGVFNLVKASDTGNVSDGDTVNFDVTVTTNNSAVFDLLLTDVFDDADYDLSTAELTLQSPNPVVPPTVGAPVPGQDNQFRFDYLQPNATYTFRASATADIPPNPGSCPDLRNTIQGEDLNERNDTATAITTYNSARPAIESPFSQNNSGNINTLNVPFGDDNNAEDTIIVTNEGDGVARNLVITLNELSGDLSGYIITVLGSSNGTWAWNPGSLTFTYTGDLQAGASTTFTYRVTAANNTCPGPGQAQLEWNITYEDLCGIVIPPTTTSPETNAIRVTNVPTLDIAKSVSNSVINIGEPDNSYRVTLTNGNNVESLPSDGVNATATNGAEEWTVRDVLPEGITNIVFEVPPGTFVTDVFGNVYTGPAAAAAANLVGTEILWRGDQEDLTVPLPELRISFEVAPDPDAICPGGRRVNNVATFEYPSCNIGTNPATRPTGSASFIGNASPGGSVSTQNLAITGPAPTLAAVIEVGAADTNGTASDEAGEGEPIQIEVSYELDGFDGTWEDSVFQASLGEVSDANLSLDLLQTSPQVELTIITADGATFVTNLGASRTALPNGGFSIPLDAVATIIGRPDIEGGDQIIVRYAATAPETALTDPTNPGELLFSRTYIETTELEIGGVDSAISECGGNLFRQGSVVTIARPEVNISARAQAPDRAANVVALCENFDLDVRLSNPGFGTSAEAINIVLQRDPYLFVDDSVNGFTFSGELATINGAPDPVNPANIAIDRTNPNQLGIAPTPASTEFSDAGAVSFVSRLLPDFTNATGIPGNTNIRGDFVYRTNTNQVGDLGGEQELNQPLATILSPNIVITTNPTTLLLTDTTDYTWDIVVTNNGTGPLSNGRVEIQLPTGFSTNGSSDPAFTAVDSQNYTLDLPDPFVGSQSFTVSGTIDQTTCFRDTENEFILSEVTWGCNPADSDDRGRFSERVPPIEIPADTLEINHLSSSYCELCGNGEITLAVINQDTVEVSNIIVVEDLQATGLTYVPGSTTVSIDGGAFRPIADVAPSAGNEGFGVTAGTTITWDFTRLAAEPEFNGNNSLSPTSGTNPNSVRLRFEVASPGETIIDNVLEVRADATYDLFCSINGGPDARDDLPAVFDIEVLPLRQPDPRVDIAGRNVSAGQNDYTTILAPFNVGDTAGGTADRTVWRVGVENLGDDELEDLLIEDVIELINASTAINFSIEDVCAEDPYALNDPLNIDRSSCDPIGLSAASVAKDVDDPFGNPGNDQPTTFFDVTQGDTAFVYFAGTMLNQCQDNQSTTNIEWGCEINPPAGGINSATAGVIATAEDTDSAFMSATVDPSGLQITQTIAGANPGQPLGINGTVTLNIFNQTGGTIRNLDLTSLLPADYLIDTSNRGADSADFTLQQAFGNPYPGQIAAINVDTSNAAQPGFTFSSSAADNANPGIDPNQLNVLRHGDRLIVTFDILRQGPFDALGNPELREETVANGADPAYLPGNVSFTLQTAFLNTCTDSFNLPDAAVNVDVDPADYDVNINPADPNLLFILSDPGDPLDLSVVVTNNGGNTATNGELYVTIGDGINVETLPAGCALAARPAILGAAGAGTPSDTSLLPVIEPTAVSYLCALSAIDPLTAQTLIFGLERDNAATPGDDLTFRADILAEVTQADGSSLPASNPPLSDQDGYPYYSLDNVLARIIGFSLSNRLTGTCSEGSLLGGASTDGLNRNSRVTIGEDCPRELQATWFGFSTPGFTVVDIVNARIFDGTVTAPDPVSAPDADPKPAVQGQGVISVTSGFTGGLTIVQERTETTVAEPAGFLWSITDPIPGSAGTDQIFTASLVNRTLNDALNSRAAPNLHSQSSVFETDASFIVNYQDTTGATQSQPFDFQTSNYPASRFRNVSLTVTEPLIEITRAVCNQTLAPGGVCGPGDFVATDATTPVIGDSDDTFIYRLTISNQPAADGIDRASAYDVSLTEVFDSTDLLTPNTNFAADGLDNDGDGTVDEADEATIQVSGGPANNGIPSQLIFAASDFTQLAEIEADPADNVILQYIATFASGIDVIPGQRFTNRATASYDTLANTSGAQATPQGASGARSGAREYESPESLAVISIDNVMVPPGGKQFIDTALDGICATPPCIDEEVTIGEEVRVQLNFDLPLATYFNFSIIDQLPAGLRCVQAFPVELPVRPADDPGFTGLTGPATVAAAECNENIVRWSFGDGVLEGSSSGDTYRIMAEFIARVENVAANVDGSVIVNGGDAGSGGTRAVFTFDDDADETSATTTEIAVDAATLTLQEPDISIVKTIQAVDPATTVDAADRAEVTIRAVNNGSTAGYNLSILDNLIISPDFQFIPGSVSGSALPDSQLPDTVDTTTPQAPVFGFNNPVGPGDSVSFSFLLEILGTVEPTQVLENTAQASYTSLPGQNTALNTAPNIGTAGQIGADGDALGQRNGSLPNAGSTLNDYESESTGTIEVPPVSLIKNDLTPGAVFTIGTRKPFEIVIDLPEGQTRGLNVRDDLGAGVESFVLENNPSFNVVYVFEDIASVNGTDPATLTTPEAVEAALISNTATDQATGIVTWNFGDIVTDSERDPDFNAVNPRIVIRYTARVPNQTAVVAGVSLQNAASITFTNRDGIPQNVVAPSVGPFTVQEPQLVTTKTGDALIGADAPASFSIAVVNQNIPTASTAWDLVVTDVLPDLTPEGGMCDAAPVVTSVDINGAAVNPAAFNFNWDQPTCRFTLSLVSNETGDPLTNNALDVGETLTINYQAGLDNNTPASISLVNVAGVTAYTGLDTDGTVPDEFRAYANTLTTPPLPLDTTVPPVSVDRRGYVDPAWGSVGVNDFQDAHVIEVEGAQVNVIKRAINVTTGQDPAITASPGDRIRYILELENVGPARGTDVIILDDVDQENPARFFENFPAGTLDIGSIVIDEPSFSNSVNNSLASGGIAGSGLLDLQNLTLGDAGETENAARVEFEAVLDDVILNTSVVRNRAQVTGDGFESISNESTFTITASRAFLFEKTATDINGGDSLLEGEEILYTITLRNISNEDVIEAQLQDQIPANTTYVAGSTTVNGNPVADAAEGVSPLQDGLTVNSPDNTTAGRLTASSDLTANNQVTVTFRVLVDAELVDGTILSNQAAISGQGAATGPFETQFSDDPSTPRVLGDPTQSIVGNGPILDMLKTVEVVGPGAADGTADVGDTLRYTLIVSNTGNLPAQSVRLSDTAPGNTRYVAGSTTLNGISLPDDGSLPLASGILINSSGTEGQIDNGQDAEIIFDVVIQPSALPGSIIQNQSLITSTNFGDELSDADGNDENGDQPTVIGVGASENILVTKEVVVVGGGQAEPDRQLQYIIQVDNIGTVAIPNLVVEDSIPANTTYVDNSARLNGSANGITGPPTAVNASYGATYGELQPGTGFTLTFNVVIDPTVAIGTRISNQVRVIRSVNELGSDLAEVDVGGSPGVATMGGLVFHDLNINNLFDLDGTAEPVLVGWKVDTYVNSIIPSNLIDTTVTDEDGRYEFTGFTPGETYFIRFEAPNNVDMGQTAAAVGIPEQMAIVNIATLSPGQNAQQQNLPVEPLGVFYDSVTRAPVGGVTVEVQRADGTPLPAACFADPDAARQFTTAEGFYAYELTFADPAACPEGGEYQLVVDEAPEGYFSGLSRIIPVEPDSLVARTCPDDANPATLIQCEVQVQGTPPDSTVSSAAGTRYYDRFTLRSNDGPQGIVINNHFPIDPDLEGVIAISKTSPLKNVVRGQLVPYTIRLSNTLGDPVTGIEIRDLFPAGFKYVEGSSRINGVEDEPDFLEGQQMIWRDLQLGAVGTANESTTIKMLLIIGSGVGEGEYINRAVAFITALDDQISGEASATVRVVPDPTFDCSDIIGKVFNDLDANGYQDKGEPGIPGTRVTTANGLLVTTDEHGRFHLTCAMVPNEDRGSNFILKVDDRTLPAGFRTTTENPRVERLTRGKMAKFNFGAALHKVIRLDLMDAAFDPDETTIRAHWSDVMADMYAQLEQGPSVLRLSYLGDRESEQLVKQRLKAVRQLITDRWSALGKGYHLEIETEVFWRTGRTGNQRQRGMTRRQNEQKGAD